MLDLLMGIFYILGIAAGVIFKDDILWFIDKIKERIGNNDERREH